MTVFSKRALYSNRKVRPFRDQVWVEKKQSRGELNGDGVLDDLKSLSRVAGRRVKMIGRKSLPFLSRVGKDVLRGLITAGIPAAAAASQVALMSFNPALGMAAGPVIGGLSNLAVKEASRALPQQKLSPMEKFTSDKVANVSDKLLAKLMARAQVGNGARLLGNGAPILNNGFHGGGARLLGSGDNSNIYTKTA